MKPLNLIALLMISVVLFSACSKTTVTRSGPGSGTTTTTTNPTITSIYYFKGTLDGTALTWQVNDGVNGFYVGSTADLSSDQGITTGALGGLLSAPTALYPSIDVEIRTFQVSYLQDKSLYFNSSLKTGSIPYAAVDTMIVNTKALVIKYCDKSKKEYTSIGAQTGSANILAVTPVAATFGVNESLKIKITFACKLYPADGTGGTLTLTNAEATVRVEDLL